MTFVYGALEKADVLNMLREGDRRVRLLVVGANASNADVGDLLDVLAQQANYVRTLDLRAHTLTVTNARKLGWLLRKNTRVLNLWVRVDHTRTTPYGEIAQGYVHNTRLRFLRFMGPRPQEYDKVRDAFVKACCVDGHPKLAELYLSDENDENNLYSELLASNLLQIMTHARESTVPVHLVIESMMFIPRACTFLQLLVETVPRLESLTIRNCVVDTRVYLAVARGLLISASLRQLHVIDCEAHDTDFSQVDAAFVHALRTNAAIATDSDWWFTDCDDYARLKK